MKYYAVKKGRKPGIYKTWEEAEKQVKGYSGAIFKSFGTKQEAERFNGTIKETRSTHLNRLTPPLSPISSTTPTLLNTYEAYVDGSFNRRLQQYGSGIVILKDQQLFKKFALSGADPNYIESFQIAGEVLGVLHVMEWAIKHSIKTLIIYYDYQGIESWALGRWKTNKNISKDYKAKFDELSSQIVVLFKKVKAHSGDTYNELADELAKKAANTKIKK